MKEALWILAQGIIKILIILLTFLLLDLIEIASYIKKKYNYEIVLIGESWGSFISSLAISSRPDLFKAYIGYGQLYSIKETIKWQKKQWKINL